MEIDIQWDSSWKRRQYKFYEGIKKASASGYDLHIWAKRKPTWDNQGPGLGIWQARNRFTDLVKRPDKKDPLQPQKPASTFRWRDRRSHWQFLEPYKVLSVVFCARNRQFETTMVCQWEWAVAAEIKSRRPLTLLVPYHHTINPCSRSKKKTSVARVPIRHFNPLKTFWPGPC